MFLPSLLGCVPSVIDEPTLYFLTDVSLEQDNLTTALPDAELTFFGASSSDEGLCTPTIRLEFESGPGDYMVSIDLLSHTSSTQVASPEPPIGDWPPTLRFLNPARYITGGPVHFESTLDAEEPIHTLRFEAPFECMGSTRDTDAPCEIVSDVVLEFTGRFDQRAYCNTAASPGEVLDPSGRPYCLSTLEDPMDLCIDDP